LLRYKWDQPSHFTSRFIAIQVCVIWLSRFIPDTWVQFVTRGQSLTVPATGDERAIC